MNAVPVQLSEELTKRLARVYTKLMVLEAKVRVEKKKPKKEKKVNTEAEQLTLF